jgi:uncharacterized membrane protein
LGKALMILLHSLKSNYHGMKRLPKFSSGETAMPWPASTTIQDRVLASLPYLLPLITSLGSSGVIWMAFPTLGNIILPLLLPILLNNGIISFSTFVIFFVLFLLVVRNEQVSRFIRFNTMQALLLEIVLSLSGIVLSILGAAPGSGLILVGLSSVVMIGVWAIIIFSVVQSLRGLYAEVPTLSDAAYTQVR